MISDRRTAKVQSEMKKWCVFAVALLTLARCGVAQAQRAVTLQEAVDAALTHGPRLSIVRADSLAAAARVLSARAYPNPTASLSYSKSAPRYHIELEQPFDYPFVRNARIRAATMGAQAAAYMATADRAALGYDVDIAYSNAAAGLLIRKLSAQNATDAREMVRITREREKAGDASALDVTLADVAAGQAEMQATTDSLQATAALLELQAQMGIVSSSVDVVPSDSLSVTLPAVTPPAIPLRVSAAQQQVQAEEANVAAARAARIPELALRVGLEWGETENPSLLEPLFGVSLPLPLWDRNRGPIAEARAAQSRAQAELALAQLESQNALTLAQHQLAAAQVQVERGRSVVGDARRVATLALTAYREGEYTLANVLEAQRNAREAVRAYVEALQSSRTAQAAVLRAQIVGGPSQ